MHSDEPNGGDAAALAVFAVLGVGLLALFAGFDWFWLVFVLGFAVVVPAVAILTDDVQEEPPSDRDRNRSWWDGVRYDLQTDDWLSDLATGMAWPDPERERKRDRDVRERFGVPIDSGTERPDGPGDGSDGVRPDESEPDGDVQAALAELRARYARGEITDERFDAELDRLLDRDGDADPEPERA